MNLTQLLNAPIRLKPGSVCTGGGEQHSAVAADAGSSLGQTVSRQTIDNTPLNGRNWVFIAQLTAGMAPGIGSSGTGTGDFSANGQREEENDFILDGVDNNDTADFLNGASFVVLPPPDALAEFKVETSDAKRVDGEYRDAQPKPHTFALTEEQ